MTYNIPCRSNPMPYYKDNSTPDYSAMPLTFKSHGSTSLYLFKNGSPPSNTFYYNRNNTGWLLYTTNATGPILNLTDGLTVSFSGVNHSYSYNNTSDNQLWRFRSSTTNFNSNYLEVYGNIESVHNYGELISNNTYRAMFRDCRALSSAWNLILPVSGSNNYRDGAFASMFRSSSVRICPKMIYFLEGQASNSLDYTFEEVSNQFTYVGISSPNWNGLKGGIRMNDSSSSIFAKTSGTTINYNIPSNVTVVNLHLDGTYWKVNRNNNTLTGEQVYILNGAIVNG